MTREILQAGRPEVIVRSDASLETRDGNRIFGDAGSRPTLLLHAFDAFDQRHVVLRSLVGHAGAEASFLIPAAGGARVFSQRPTFGWREHQPTAPIVATTIVFRGFLEGDFDPVAS